MPSIQKPRLNRRPWYTFQLSPTKTQQTYALPNDIQALAQLEFLLYGYLIATYASGTPVSKYGSVMQSFIETIGVARGSDYFKSLSPEMLQYENALLNKNFNVIRATAGATPTNNPNSDVTSVPYGTTGQYQNFREACTLHFGYPYWVNEKEYFATMFRTTNISTANVQIQTKGYLNIRDDENTAPVVYSADALYLQVNIVEYTGDDMAFAALGACMYDYRQEEQTATYSAKTKDLIKLPRTGAISSILMSTRDGAAGSATTATSKMLSDAVFTNVKLVRNQETAVDSTWLDLKDQVKRKMNVQFPKVAGIARDDGFSGILYTENGFKSLFDISQDSGYSVANLVVDTNDSSNVAYAKNASVRICVNQVANIKK